jgi:arginine/ornithine N-succinyltransferase beta subunit
MLEGAAWYGTSAFVDLFDGGPRRVRVSTDEVRGARVPEAKRTAQGQSRFFIALHSDDRTMPRAAGVRFGKQDDNPFANGVPRLSVSCCRTKV